MRVRGSPRWSGWHLWSLPRGAIAYVLSVEATAVLVAVAGVLAYPMRQPDLVSLAWIALWAALGIELSQRVERLRERHRDTPYKTLQGVWAGAAVLILPPSLIWPLVIFIYLITWWRVGRFRPYRWTLSTAVAVTAYGLAAVVYDQLAGPDAWDGALTSDPAAVPAAVAALVLATVVNLALVGGAILLSDRSASRREAFGGWAEQGVEASALCLGVLVAAGYSVAPALVPFALPVLLLLQRSLLLAQFQAAARRDPKTGLANAQWWHEIAGREVERARRLGEQVSVLIADLDHFKTVNDSHGHLAGDAVLRAVAASFGDEVREYDVVGRFGGEEFVVVLPNTGADRAYAVAERLREQITRLSVPIEGADMAPERIADLSISIGLAELPTHGTDLTDLLQTADAALYVAKEAGRNQVRVGPARPNAGVDRAS